MDTNILTQILKRFTIYLEDLPSNLRLITHTLLFFLATIDIALTIYTNIDNPDFSYYKWMKNKILKIGFIIFAINQYEWLLAGVKSFFFDVVEKAIRIKIYNSDYFENPSLLYKKGSELAFKIYDEGVSWWKIDTWIFTIFYFLILVGFLIMTLQLITCWIEYYFLTGISIIFLPFGALDLGLTYYKNVFNVVISATIKIAVMNFWLLLGSNIMDDLFKISVDDLNFDKISLIVGVVYILMGIMQVLPSLTTGLLSGTPAVNASAAIAGATGAAKSMARGVADAYRGGKETVKGAFKGAKTGGNFGGATGSALGSLAGPVGIQVGNIVGGTLGAVGGAVVGGSYAGARYAVFKEKAKDKVDNSNSNNTSSGSSGGSGSSGSGNSGGSSSNSSTTQSPSNSSGGSNSGSSPQPPSNSPSSGSSGGSGSSSNGNSGGSPNNSSTSQVPSNSSGVSNSGSSSQPPSNSPSSGDSNGGGSSGNGNVGGSQNNGSTPQTPSNSNDNTNSVADNSTSANTNMDTTNNVSESNSNTPNTTSTDTNTSSDNITTTDTGDSPEKRGIKVNGGEAGKLPDWMDGDY